MIYIVMQKCLATETVTAVAAFNTLVDARVWMNRAIDADDTAGYRIDTVQLNPVSLAF